MSVAADSDAEMRVYDRLGPLAKAAIGNAHRILDIAFCLNQFQRGRGPIERNGDFYPAPAYNSPEGDAEFSQWIDKVIHRDIGMTSEELKLVPWKEGRITKLAMHLHRILWRKVRQ